MKTIEDAQASRQIIGIDYCYLILQSSEIRQLACRVLGIYT